MNQTRWHPQSWCLHARLCVYACVLARAPPRYHHWTILSYPTSDWVRLLCVFTSVYDARRIHYHSNVLIVHYHIAIHFHILELSNMARARACVRAFILRPHRLFLTSTQTYKVLSLHAPKFWNTLPSSLRSLSSTPIFKSKLKTYLFSIINPSSQLIFL